MIEEGATAAQKTAFACYRQIFTLGGAKRSQGGGGAHHSPESGYAWYNHATKISFYHFSLR